MTVRRRVALAASTAALGVAVPGVASAATRAVWVGPPTAAARSLQSVQADVNDFFPHRAVIRAGDTVRFVPRGFHTVDLPPRSGHGLPLILPTGQTIAGVTNTAGAPFWFNGQPELSFNPALTKIAWGTRATYTGTARLNSGLAAAPSVKPFRVRFTKAGRFTYFCDVHPGMKGIIRVLPRGAAPPSRRANALVLRRQVTRDLHIARRLPETGPPRNVVDLGSAGRFGVERFAMFPETLSVGVGQPVTFRMSPRSFEVHTATFGPGSPMAPPTLLGQLAATFAQTGPFDPRALYPSERPGTPSPAITPTLNGNGFWNSGVLDVERATTTIPVSSTVTFGAPGTYNYYCLIHPQMHGVIQVR